jgi:hypothetical protein
MLASIIWRGAGFAAFTGFGIAWATDHDDVLAVLWVLSFAWLVGATLWYSVPVEDRLRVRGLWDVLPGPSKNPDDYM